MKTVRSFLALNLSVEAARIIGDEQRRMRETCERSGGRVRWVPPQNMHVTLRFLGHITEPMVRAIKDRLERVTRSFGPFPFEVGGLGVFPEEGPPRVLWAGVTCPDGSIERLHSTVSAVLEEVGFKQEQEPFRSHVTVGRIKEECAPEGIAACLEAARGRSFGRTTVRDLVCYRSDLHAKGADYQILWRLPLLGRTARSEPVEPAEELEAPAQAEYVPEDDGDGELEREVAQFQEPEDDMTDGADEAPDEEIQ